MALIVFGVVIPVIVKSVPVREIKETVKSEAPLFVSSRLLVAFNPTDTFPKLIAAGLGDNCACALSAVADKLMTAGALPASP